MRIAFLFFLMTTLTIDQVPVVFNYDDFLTGVNEGKPTALSMDFDDNQYGSDISSLIYQEVLPINEEYQFLFSQVYESPINDKKENSSLGESYVCLCKKTDLVEVLERWKDGQKSLHDYAKFDCKHKSFQEKEKMYKGKSFWAEHSAGTSLLGEENVTHLTLSEKVDIVVYKSRGIASKNIIKVKFIIPVDDIVKVVEDETYLTSVKDEAGEELFMPGFSAYGWKAMFPEWENYQSLNSGFWGTPKNQNAIKNDFFSKTYSIKSSKGKKLSVEGVATFLAKDNTQKTKIIKDLNLGSTQRIIKSNTYLDYGTELAYGVASVLNENQQMTVFFNADIPLNEIVVFDARTGAQLGRSSKAPFECTIPSLTNHIKLKVSYGGLKKVKVVYTK